jgi:hypothetical protein
MKYWKAFLIISGVLLIIAGMLYLLFCSMVSDPEIEGDSGRTPLSAYLISLIPIGLGILSFILANKIQKNKDSLNP